MSDFLPVIDQKMTTGRWVLLATIVAASMAFIDSTALNITLPTLQSDLGATGRQLLWVSNAYLVILASLILFGGVLGDKLGRKRVYMTGIAIFVVASLACGLAPTIEFLIAMRVAQGLGGALMIPGSLALITATFEGAKRGEAIGMWASATTAVMVIGPLLGGFLAGIGFWRGVFFINIPLGLLALAVLFYKVPESRDRDAGDIDYLGALLATFSLGALAYGLISLPERGWSDAFVYGAMLAGLAGIVLFIIVESRVEDPMLPLDIFKDRTFSGANLLTLCLYAALSVFNFFLPLILVQTQGYSQFYAGLAILPFVLILALLSRWAGGAVGRFGHRLMLTVGPAIVGIGFIVLSFVGMTGGPQDYWQTYFPGILLFGLGMGITVAPLSNTVMSALGSSFAGTASGVNNATSRTAGVLGIAAVGAIALIVFSNLLLDGAQALDLDGPALQALQQEAQRLGDASVPAAVPVGLQDAVSSAIDSAFVNTYQVVMAICAGLAWISSGIALFFFK